MIKNTILVALIILLSSCSSEVKKGDAARFKHGVFEIPADKSYSKTIITRVDSLQIEEYTRQISITKDNNVSVKTVKHIDTLYITWKNNFSYTLRMKSPKTKLDKDPIFVQLTKVTDTSYSFSAKVGYSKFKQEGVVYKVK